MKEATARDISELLKDVHVTDDMSILRPVFTDGLPSIARQVLGFTPWL